MPDFKELISLISGTVDQFNKNIPGVQRQMLDDILLLTKKLDTKGDTIKLSAANLNVISQIKGRLQRILRNPDYKEAVKGYIQNFSEVVKLQNNYFKELESKFKPPKLVNEIKKQAVESVVNALTETGLNANIVDKVHELMRKASTSGGSYATLNKQLTDFIVNNESGEGQLLRYTKQISTDALNQFSGQYTQILSSDLGFEWYRYSGSNIETSRPFCLACTDRKYFHISELPKVLKGDFPEFAQYEGKINKKTHLPEGMIPGTDVSNFMVNRGGYNCGHQFRPISEDLVPAEIVARVKGKATKKTEEVKPAQVDAKKSPGEHIRDIVLANNAPQLKKFKDSGYTLHEDLLQHLEEPINFKIGKKNDGFYSPGKKEIHIGDFPSRDKSKYFRETLVAHEVGHALHNTKKIIHNRQVSPEFEALYKSLKSKIKGHEDAITKAFREKYRDANQDQKEQLVVIYDILGSLTRGKFGGGHAKTYYKQANSSEAEIFAHAVSLHKVDNEFSNLTPQVAEVISEMKSYISKVL